MLGGKKSLMKTTTFCYGLTNLSSDDFELHDEDSISRTPNAVLAMAVMVASTNSRLGWFECRSATPLQCKKFLDSVTDVESGSESD